MASDVNLVLSAFEFNPEAKEDAPVLKMEGRNSGILAQIFTFLGLDTKASLIISRKELKFRFTSLRGITYLVCPLDSLTCSLCGVEKPLWAVVSGIVGILGGLFLLLTGGNTTLALIGLVGGAAALYYYYVTKSVALTFSTGDIGDTHGLGFDATTLNGKKIGVDEILEAIAYINLMI